MCGIAGGCALEPGTRVDPGRVEAMTSRLRHRGPDGSGLWRDPDDRVVFGHRRLSVIDLETGQQPMCDPATGVVITFNGEIYNYIELRARLAASGARFRTGSDTEVLLRSYIEHGTDCLSSLRGMFAFAIWDPRSNQLVMARDRVGKKPLYHTIDDGVLYFASGFDAVTAGLPEPSAIDVEQIGAFLDLGYIPAPHSAHPAVSKLSAGHVAIASESGMSTRRFWNLAAEVEPFDGSWNDAVDRLDALITEAVAIRLRSDVPLGVFLSGGVDSSLVAAVAARQTDQVLTFSIGFDTSAFDERPWAQAVADSIGSDHRAFRTHVESLDLIPRLVHHFGEPFGDPSAIPTWLLAEETRRHVTVAVGGDGGDEGFAGYGWYETASRINRLRRYVPGAVARVGSIALSSPGLRRSPAVRRLFRVADILARDEATRYVKLRSFLDRDLGRQLLAGPLLEAQLDRGTQRAIAAADTFRRIPGSSLRKMRVLDVETYLADCLMPKVDVATMAHGLEARAPLLDHEVLEFAMSLPDEWIRNGTGGKRILRAVLDRYLPASLFERPKQGFDMPIASWFNQQLQSRIARLPDRGALIETGWFSPDGLRRLIAEHAGQRRDHSLRLYNILFLDEWLKQR